MRNTELAYYPIQLGKKDIGIEIGIKYFFQEKALFVKINVEYFY